MSKYWSVITRSIAPYTPGEQPRDKEYIKLNTNENPYPPSPRVLDVIQKNADDRLRLYPDPSCDELRRVIASHYGFEKSQVFVGNGSDEILAFAFRAFFDPDRTILFPEITYTFYPVYSQLFGLRYQLVPMDDDFHISLEGFYQRNGGIVFPNPNAPTGKYLALEIVREIVERNMDSVVIVDEAYIDFGGQSALSLVPEYPNLLIIHTLSKSRSLAGLRVGYAIGHPDLIEGLDRIKNSFNSYTLDRLALAAGAEAIKDAEYFHQTCRKVIHTRERTAAELVRMGFRVIPSAANFIFISHPRWEGAALYQKLRERGILVRHFNKPRIHAFLRVSIGTDEEMDAFLKAVEEIVR